MKVALFGASGHIGSVILEKLLEGHQVTALARTPGKISAQHPALTVLEGDALNPQAVKVAIAGQDAVISALNGEPHRRVRFDCTTNIITAMKSASVKRLVAFGGLGVLQINKWFVYQLPFFPKAMVPISEEHRAIFNALQASGLNWTMVCPPYVTSAPPRGRCRTQADRLFLSPRLRIAVADVADFVIQELAHSQYVGRRVALVSA